MSRAARSLKHRTGDQVAPRRPRPALATSSAANAASPARAMQIDLQERLSDEAPTWSTRRTLGFIVLVCGSFWVTAAAVGVRLLH